MAVRWARTGTLGRMSINTGLDFVIGGIPILGDAFDAAFKANRRNLALLKADPEGTALGDRSDGIHATAT